MLPAMKAVLIHEFGDTDVLRLEEVPLPEVEPSEVLVHIHAAGVNPIDRKLRESGGPELEPPLILGFDLSGTVEAVGEQVDAFAVGDAVHGQAPLRDGYGTYAQYAAVPADALVHKPDGIDHVHAAALPLAGLTAWQALRDHAELAAGERVLIHGGAGGVGHLAVQFARRWEAHVIATGSPDSHELLRELGADEVVDYHDHDPVEAVGQVDVVLDTVGGVVTDRSLLALDAGGRLVSTVDEPDPKLARARGVTATRMTVRSDPDQLREIDRLVERGEVWVVVEDTFPLVEVAHAHRRSAEGHVKGKLVLDLVDGTGS